MQDLALPALQITTLGWFRSRRTILRPRLHRVLVSHDGGWYHAGEPGGGVFRPYEMLFTDFLPALTAAGFTDEEIHQLTDVNPAEAFAVRVRARLP